MSRTRFTVHSRPPQSSTPLFRMAGRVGRAADTAHPLRTGYLDARSLRVPERSCSRVGARRRALVCPVLTAWPSSAWPGRSPVSAPARIEPLDDTFLAARLLVRGPHDEEVVRRGGP